MANRMRSFYNKGTLNFYDDQNNSGFKTGMWADCTQLGILCDPSAGYIYFEDFIGHTALPTSSGSAGGWKASGDATYGIASAAGTLGGYVEFTTATGSNNELYLQLGTLGTETYIEYTKNSGLKSWVEFKLNYPSITNAANTFIGLAGEGSAAANFIADSGADYADKDLVGFVIWEADPDAIDVNYQITGSAFADGGLAGVPVAATDVRLGISFDGLETVSFWKDGAVVQTVDVDTVTFPTGEELSPIIALKNGAGDAAITVDYIKMVVER